MKKIILGLAIILFAAGCSTNYTPQATPTPPQISNNPPVTTQPISTETHPSAPITPPPVNNQAAGKCDPNYSGCVPIASDVDCAGGSGNGPAYVRGPVNVIGIDIYDLDRDNDGVGCE